MDSEPKKQRMIGIFDDPFLNEDEEKENQPEQDKMPDKGIKNFLLSGYKKFFVEVLTCMANDGQIVCMH